MTTLNIAQTLDKNASWSTTFAPSAPLAQSNPLVIDIAVTGDAEVTITDTATGDVLALPDAERPGGRIATTYDGHVSAGPFTLSISTVLGCTISGSLNFT